MLIALQTKSHAPHNPSSCNDAWWRCCNIDLYDVMLYKHLGSSVHVSANIHVCIHGMLNCMRLLGYLSRRAWASPYPEMAHT